MNTSRFSCPPQKNFTATSPTENAFLARKGGDAVEWRFGVINVDVLEGFWVIDVDVFAEGSAEGFRGRFCGRFLPKVLWKVLVESFAEMFLEPHANPKIGPWQQPAAAAATASSSNQQ